MTYHVQWSQIEAEYEAASGDYRSRIIDIFRKYESLPTDEVDAQGRTVKVTMKSFERHFGLGIDTLRSWIKKQEQGGSARAPRNRSREEMRRRPADETVDDITSLPEDKQDEIFHELKLRRAGIDTSTPTRKAAEAAGNEYAGALRQSIATTHIELCIQALNDAADQLAEAIAEDVVTAEGLERIDQAHDRYVTTRHEADFKIESSERR